MGLAIEFNHSILTTFQNHINLGVLEMIMLTGIFADMGQVNCSWKFFAISKGTSRCAAGTRHWWQAAEVNHSSNARSTSIGHSAELTG